MSKLGRGGERESERERERERERRGYDILKWIVGMCCVVGVCTCAESPIIKL